MKERLSVKKVLILSLVALGLIILVIQYVEVTKSRDALRVTLLSTQDTLATAQSELVSVHGELDSAETELASVKSDLASK